jgi:hypothetical protein
MRMAAGADVALTASTAAPKIRPEIRITPIPLIAAPDESAGAILAQV